LPLLLISNVCTFFNAGIGREQLSQLPVQIFSLFVSLRERGRERERERESERESLRERERVGGTRERGRE